MTESMEDALKKRLNRNKGLGFDAYVIIPTRVSLVEIRSE